MIHGTFQDVLNFNKNDINSHTLVFPGINLYALMHLYFTIKLYIQNKGNLQKKTPFTYNLIMMHAMTFIYTGLYTQSQKLFKVMILLYKYFTDKHNVQH